MFFKSSPVIKSLISQLQETSWIALFSDVFQVWKRGRL